MRLIKVIPLCNRAKNRIREHGCVMELLMTDSPSYGSGSFLVRSLNDTFKDSGKWIGWFKVNEANYELTHSTKGGNIE